MNTILEYLQQLNFSKIEAKLYVLLLNYGPLTVAELAKKATINRTAAYPHITSLINKGFFLEIIRNGNKQLVASEPEKLRSILSEQQAEVQARQAKLNYVLTSLNSLIPKQQTKDTSEIKYYKGKNAVKSVYLDCLKAKKIRAYYDPENLEEIFPENYGLFDTTIKQTPDMLVHELVQYTPQSMKDIERSHGTGGRHIYKFLPHDIKLTANDILIYDGKVAIVNIGDKDNVTAVVLKNKEYFNNSVQLFDLLWRLLPEFPIKEKPLV